MTAYFDDANHAVAMIPSEVVGDAYLSRVRDVEESVLADVLLNTGDREFPDGMRQAILDAIAMDALAGALPPRDETVRYCSATRSSRIIPRLHSLFHALARQKVLARFGYWSDDPGSNLRLRERYDNDSGGRDP